MADVAGNSTISVPELLTQEEVVALLRLDRLGLQDPKEMQRDLPVA